MRIAAILVAWLFLSGQHVPNKDSVAQPFRRPVDTSQVLTRIAFGSCNHQFDDQGMWKTVMAADPDLWVWLGDNIYANTLSAQVMRQGYDYQLRHPEYQQLLAYCPVIGTWDDHDYGYDQADASNPIRQKSKALFLEFLGAGDDDVRRTREGIYTSYNFGEPGKTTKVILLDTRFFRQAPGENAELLGQEQWTWLKSELNDTLADLVLIASGMQVLSTKPHNDSWSRFPKEKRSLLSLLKEVPTDASRDFFISGDVHFTEALCDTLDKGVPIYEFTSSGLTHNDELSPESYDKRSITGPVSQQNFGLLTIDWSERTLLFEGRGRDGDILISKTAKFGKSSAHLN
jgi:alkaline phosphatase D